MMTIFGSVIRETPYESRSLRRHVLILQLRRGQRRDLAAGLSVGLADRLADERLHLVDRAFPTALLCKFQAAPHALLHVRAVLQRLVDRREVLLRAFGDQADVAP